jgi:ATP-dependent RNA helicase DeaD
LAAPAEAEPSAERHAEPKRKKRRKKVREAERRPAEPTAKAPADVEPSAERHAEPTRKKRSKRAPDSEREPARGRPVEAQEDVAPAEAISAEADRRSEPKRKEAHKKSRDVEQKPKRDRGQLPAFGSLALSDDMLEALAEAGYEEPTPVQAGLIPKALEGHDLMGQARTGTGKTAAFGIPLLERFGSGEKRKETAALILVPTRELAVQVRDELTKLAGRSRVTTVAVYGGKPIRGQIEHLRRGAEIVVGTPGRVIDLIDRRALNLAALECVVLDEADRMLDIGFRPDIEKILRRCPQARQTLLLSATIPPPVKRLAERYMHEPEMLDFSPQDVAVETIEQFYFTVDPRQKFDLLMKLIEREDPKQAIVFCRTKKGTDRVGTRLGRKLKGAAMIHGDLQQRQRDRVMADFRAGKIRFLAATDVVGRGIDVSGISHIINFDIPQFCDDYIHRVGRTGRMGREGVAYTFVSPEEGNELTRIEIRINRLLIRDEIPGFLAIPRPEPTEELDKPEGEQPKPKPVFGKRTRRIRRAL